MIKAIALILGLASSSFAAQGYTNGPTINTTTGKVTQSWAGVLNVAVSSATLSTPASIISGSTGVTIGGPNPWFDITSPRFGAVSDGSVNGGTDNTVAIRAAIAAATATASGGGVVFIPAGKFYKGSSTIIIPASVRVIGNGPQTTFVYSTGAAYGFQLGNTAGTLSYGTEFSNINLTLLGINSNGIDLYGTQGAILHNDIISGNVHAGVGVLIDGANISSFRNHIDDVFALHVQTGIKCLTSGTTNATQQFITNFFAFGDDNTSPNNGSVGIDIASQASGKNDCTGTQIFGGDLESVTTGIYLRNYAQDVYASGVRFENGSETGQQDVIISTGASGCTLTGLANMGSGISDSSTGNQFNSYFGNFFVATPSLYNTGSPALIQSVKTMTLDASTVSEQALIYLSTGPTGTGIIKIQAGNISAANGGGLILYANANATHTGDVVAGLSNGAGTFRINASGIDGGNDYFRSESSGTTISLGFLAPYSRSFVQLQAITPTAIGQTYFCSSCSPKKLVISTATTVGAFADPSGGAFQ